MLHLAFNLARSAASQRRFSSAAVSVSFSEGAIQCMKFASYVRGLDAANLKAAPDIFTSGETVK